MCYVTMLRICYILVNSATMSTGGCLAGGWAILPPSDTDASAVDGLGIVTRFNKSCNKEVETGCFWMCIKHVTPRRVI
jgi:hypothetical protein